MTQAENTKPRAEQQKGEGLLLGLDLIMIVALVANLSWLVFDSLFAINWVENFLVSTLGTPAEFYRDQVHPNFFAIDLVFVAFFLSEFLFSWVLAVLRKTHGAWWYYPFIHWYDLLGCIPLAGFRILRVLRIITILYRLQRMQLIELRGWRIFQLAKRAYDIVIEEVSDRVVVNVLDGAQDEILAGGVAGQRIIDEVVRPRKEIIVDAAAIRLQATIQESYADNRRAIDAYVHKLIGQAMHDTADLKLLDRVPLLGSFINRRLDHTVGDIVCKVIANAISRLDSEDYRQLVMQISDSAFEGLLKDRPGERDDGPDLAKVVVDVLEIVKDQVSVRRWQLDAPQASNNPTETPA